MPGTDRRSIAGKAPTPERHAAIVLGFLDAHSPVHAGNFPA